MDAATLTGENEHENDAPKKTDHRTRFELGWIAAVERAQELLAKGEWEPILIADNVPDECRDEVDSHRYVYWTETVSADGLSLWAATLFAMSTRGHAAGIEAKTSSYRKYKEDNEDKLFADEADPEKWEILVSTGERPIDGYKVMEKGKLKTFSDIEPDATLEINHDGYVIATPAVFEIETSHRSLPQLAEHAGLLFKGWPELAVFEGVVVRPRQIVGDDAEDGPFPAHYFLMCRNFDKPSTLRVEKFLSIGTAPSGARRDTIEAVLKQWSKFGVTEVCGKVLDDSFNVDAAITDLNEDQRAALCGALKNKKRKAPDAVKDVLAFDIENSTLYGPGSWRDKSGHLPVDLYEILRGINCYKDRTFTGIKRPAPEV